MSWRNLVNDVSVVYVLLAALRNLPVLTAGLSLKTQPLPTSIRQALLDRSKALNPSTEYTEAGWSNRAATVLTPVHESGIHTADRPFLWNNIDVGCRATMVELPNQQLWVHSPVSLDGPMMEAVKQLGTTVAFVVTPNYEHTKYASSWYQNYNATMVGCPGLAERMPEVQWTCEVPVGARPKGFDGSDTKASSLTDGWDTDILEALHINIEENPFTGRPFFNEVVFFHKPSKTLMTTDLFWNYPKSGIPNEEFGRNDSWDLAPALESGVPFGSRAWKFGMDRVYYPFYTNLMVTDQEEYRKITNHIVNVWQPEMIVPAHGDIMRGKDFIREVLTKFFRLPTNPSQTTRPR